MTDYADIPLLEVAKQNTPAALDYFWAHVDDGYFAAREWFYDEIAHVCYKTLLSRDYGRRIRALDIGCACGHFVETLARKTHDMDITLHGWDFALSAVTKATDKQIPRTLFSCWDITKVRQAPITYELITCLQSLEHIHEYREALENIYILLADGGDFILTIPNGEIDRWNGHVNFWIEEEMRDILEQYGPTNSWGFNENKNLAFHMRKMG